MKAIVSTPNYTKFIKLHCAFLFVLLSVNFNVLFAQTAVPFSARYNKSLRGDLTMISNNILNRRDNSGGPNVPYTGSQANDRLNMRYIDVDNDSNTFSSSSATLAIPNYNTCSKVKFAGLYWGAIYRDSNRNSNFRSVKFKVPGSGSYKTVAATSVIFDTQGTFASDPYACFADVTNLVTGLTSPEGKYTVADIFANQGSKGNGAPFGGSSAGWTLIIVYENPTLPNRNITVFDGFSGVRDNSTANIPVAGFTTLPVGPVRARIAVSCLEGDLSLRGDGYSISTGQNNGTFTPLTNTINPANNFFNSSISITDRNRRSLALTRKPNCQNTLGWDSDLFNILNSGNLVIGNNETSATLRLQTSGDQYFVFQTSFIVDNIEPKIILLKTVDDGMGHDLAGKNVKLGESMWYELNFKNSGNDDAINTTIEDILPINVDLDVNSIIIPNFGVSYTHTPPTKSSAGILKFTIADALVTKGGANYRIRFKVTVKDKCNELRDACENEIKNQAFASYKGKVSKIYISDDPSFYGLDKCGIGEPGATNFLVDVKDCAFKREVVMCSGSLKLTAGSGYASYVWKTSEGKKISGGNKQSLTVTSIGIYKVYKKGATSCVDAMETITVVPFNKGYKNPLIATNSKGGYLYVDEVFICPNNGSQLSEIYLCGSDSFRDINILAERGVDFKWQKLDKSLEGDAFAKCPNLKAEDKNWTTVSSNNSFRVEDAGDYRLEVAFQNKCFVRYYFNVFKVTVKPTFEGTNINCGKDGSIAISNISIKSYEFSVVLNNEPIGKYSSKINYKITKAGTYKVYYRHKGTSIDGCVSKEIYISDNKIKVNKTVTDITCKKDKGSIRVQVSNVDGDYTFELKIWGKKKGAAIETFEPYKTSRSIKSNDYTFKDLSEGLYQVIVKTDQCLDTIKNIKIKKNDPLTLKASVSKDISCNKGEIELVAKGGKKEYSYAIHSYKLEGESVWTFIEDKKYDYKTAKVGEVFKILIKDAGTYRFIVSDHNLCTAESNTVKINKYKPEYEVTKTDIKCNFDDKYLNKEAVKEKKCKGTITIKLPKNLNGNSLSFALDDGIVGNGKYDAILSDGTYVTTAFKPKKTFPKLLAGKYTLVVRIKKGESTCYFKEGIEIKEPKNKMWGELLLMKNSCNTSACLWINDVSEIILQGGVRPFKYSIDGKDYQKSRNFPKDFYKIPAPKGLPAGDYYGYIKDANGCVFKTKKLTVKKLTPPTDLTFTETTITCPSKTTDVTISDVDGGVAPYTYKIISPVANKLDNKGEKVFKELSSGTYMFKVTDKNKCSYKESYTVNSIKSISVTGVVDNDVICKGTATGKATFTVTGITDTYSYFIDKKHKEDKIIKSKIITSGLSAGKHTIKVTDDTTKCTDTLEVTIKEPSKKISISLKVKPAITCKTDATITVTASGGAGSFEYKLKAPKGIITRYSKYSNISVFTDIKKGTYTIYVKDGKRCVSEKTIKIKPAIKPTVTISANTKCYTSKNKVTITAVGKGTSPFSYSLKGKVYQKSNIFKSNEPGDYTVTVKDKNGCTGASLPLTVYPEIKITVKFSSITACGSSTNITITAIGGDGTYTYAIVKMGIKPLDTDFSATMPIAITGKGIYDVYVKDSKGCKAFEKVTVTKDPALSVTVIAESIKCSGDVTTLKATAVGGKKEYTYSLLDADKKLIGSSQKDATFKKITKGSYFVRISDKNSCTATSIRVDVTEPIFLSAAVGVTELVSCNNNLKAEVRIANVSGGTPFASPNLYRYSFDNETTYITSNTQKLPVGMHTVFVKDKNGCKFSMEVEVAAKLTAPDYTKSLTYSCSGKGVFNVVPVDPKGLFSYTYTIDGGKSLKPNYKKIGHQFTGLKPKKYTVEMNYTSLSTPTKSVLFRETFGTGANTTNTNVGPAYCYEPQDGTGSCNFGRSINDGEYCVTQVVADPFGTWLSPNDHTKDVNGRFLVINIGNTVGANGIIYQQAVTDVIPNRDITVQLSAFNLLKSTVTGQADPNIVVQLTDAQGNVLRDASNNPIQKATKDIPKNKGVDDWNDYAMKLNPGSNTAFKIVIRSNSIVIMGNDIAIDDILAFQEPKQCPRTIELEFEVKKDKEFKVSINKSKDVTCNGGKDGSITFGVENFDPLLGYKYKTKSGSWSKAQFSNSLKVSNLAAGNHKVSFEYIEADKSKGCVVVSKSKTIEEPTAVVASAKIDVDYTCSNTGATISASATGGGGSYQYQLENLKGGIIKVYQTKDKFPDIATGSYMVRVKDGNECEDVIDKQIDIAAPTPIKFTLVQTKCYKGDNKGSIVVTVTDGNGTYEFSRNGTSFYKPNSSTPLTYAFKDLASGDYTITVRDKYGCSISKDVTIKSGLSASAGLVKDIECKKPTKGKIKITSNGGAGTKTYKWSDDAGVTWNGSNISSTSKGVFFTYGTAGSYIFKVTDASKCEVTTKKIDLTLPIQPEFTLSPTDVLCNGDNTGSIKVTIDTSKGREPKVSKVYNITLSKDLGVVKDNLLAGKYRVTVTDKKGCSFEKSITISEPKKIAATVVVNAIHCVNGKADSTGSIEINNIKGGTAPYTFDITSSTSGYTNSYKTTASENHIFSDLSFGSYNIVITDSNGCEIKIDDKKMSSPPDALDIDVSAAIVDCKKGGSVTVTVGAKVIGAKYKFGILTITKVPYASKFHFANSSTPRAFTFDGLTPGVKYTFVVQDIGNKCYYFKQMTVAIVSPSGITSTITPHPVTCTGSDDGTFDFTVKNYAIGATSVDWIVKNVFTNTDYSPVISGTLNVNPPIPGTGVSVTGKRDLPPGKYYILFTENKGANTECTKVSNEFEIKESTNSLKITAKLDKNENCNDKGIIKATATFGTSPYTYQIQLSTDPIPTFSKWTGVNTNGEFKKAKGTYKVFVKDAFNCIQVSSDVIVGLDPSPVITATPDYKDCPSEGSFKVSIKLNTAGTPPYTIQINGGAKISVSFDSSKTYVKSGLSSGKNTFEVFDANGCSEKPIEVIITAPLEFDVTVSKLLDCSTSPNAEIKITGLVGSGKYTYEIVGVETGANNQVAGTLLGSTPTIWKQANIKSEYKITIKDSNTGCSVTKSVFVNDKIKPLVDSSQGTDVTCSGVNDGSISITAKNNGVKTFTFEITAPRSIAATTSNGLTATFNKLEGSATGIVYTVKITGANGCVTNKKVTIKEPSLVSIDQIDMIQFGCTTGNSPNTASITVVKVIGGNGGSAGTYTKIEFFNSDGDPVQSGKNNTLKILYDTAKDSYDVDMGTKTPGEFTINVYDSKGCKATSTRTIKPFDAIKSVSVKVVESISCKNNGENIKINVVSSNSDFTKFKYSDDNGTTWKDSNKFNDLKVGIHYFLVRHKGTNCVFPINHQVKEPNTFTPRVKIVSQVNCKASTTGEVTFELEDALYLKGFTWEVFDTKGTLADVIDDTFVKKGTEAANGPTAIVKIAAGSYYVVITQSKIPTCNNKVYFTINEPALVLSGTRTFNPITCAGNDGKITISPKGGWKEYQYYIGDKAPSATSWVSTSSFTGLDVDTYQVWLRDKLECEVQLPDVVLKNPTAITATLDITNSNCLGTNGAVKVINVAGGAGVNYKYQLYRNGIKLGDAQSSPVFGNLTAGSYHVDVTDSWSCKGRTGKDIKLYEVLVPRIKVVKEIDCSTTNSGGSLTASVTGGSGKFNYKITLPDNSTRSNTTGVFTSLGLVGTYTIGVTDTQTKCSISKTATLALPSTVELLPSTVTNVKCYGGANGTITVNMDVATATTNNEPAYTYQIIAGPQLVALQNSPVFTGLLKGTYKIRVVSSKKCEAIITEDVKEPVVLSVKASATTFACTSNNSTNTVVLTAVAANGTGDYLYSINDVDFRSSNTFDIVDTGIDQKITVFVKDNNACTAATVTPVVIKTLPSLISIVVSQNKAISCKNPENVIVTVVGGSGNFTYELLPVGTNTKIIVSPTQDFDLSSTGSYTFKVIDNVTGCSIVSAPYDVASYDVISVETLATQSSKCFGDTNGALEFKVLNYTGDFSWRVQNLQGTVVSTGNSNTAKNPIKVSNLKGGNLLVYVEAKDPAYCDALSNGVVITFPSGALSLTLNVSKKETCDPGKDGEITAIGAYGWGTYEYQLELGATIVAAYSSENVFSNLNSGTYTVRVKDKKGCSIFKSIEIKPALPIAATASANSLLCYGDLIGVVTVVAAGGQGAGTYVYSLVDADGNPSAYQSNPVFSNLVAGTYTVLVTDDLSCEVITLPVTVVAPPIVVASARITTTLSCTVSGVIQVTASGGDGGPFSYSKDGVTFSSVNTFTVSPLVSTTYQYFAKDHSGCISYVSNGITVHPIAPLKVIIDAVNATISCNGGTSAVISSITSGGMGNYSYELLNANDVVLDGPQNSSIFTGLGAGIYKVRVNSLDCKQTSDPVTLTDPKMLKLPLRPIFTNISCYGEIDGTITVDAEGGTGKLIYSIDQVKYVNSNKFKGLKAGLYKVTVQDENGCYVNQEITIVEPKLLEFKFGLIHQEKCANDKDGSIAIIITGGTAPYFTKLNADGVFVEGKLLYDNLEGGHTYAIYLKDSSGCDKNLVVKLDAPVDLNFETMIDYGCDGNTKIIASVALQYKNEVSYIMVNDSNTLTNTTGVFENLTPGTYLIEVEHENGCSPSPTYVDVKKVLPLVASLEETFVNTITAKVEYGIPPYEYRIDGGDYGNSNQFIINKTGTYTVDVRDSRGCITSAKIDMEFITVFIPNFFTPDGDGKNDYWYPQKLMAYPNIKVSIYDRYSRLVGEFRGPQIGWDGNLKGKALPSGDYWYVIELDGLQGDIREMMGNFTLYR